jgi:hypothetical protein
MPVLKNARHEAFAQALAKGKLQEDAYAEAGFKPHKQNASRLMTNDDVRRRVDEIRTRIAEKAEWSAAERLQALKRITDASEGSDPRVAVSAISEANKMQGSHAPTRNEHTGKNGAPIMVADLSRLKGMTAEELQILERALVQIGIAEGDQDRTGEPEE